MFIDTNILVTSRIPTAPDHNTARASLERALQNSEPLRISRQIVREYLAVVTRPQTWEVSTSRQDALDDVNRLISNLEILGPVYKGRLIATDGLLGSMELPARIAGPIIGPAECLDGIDHIITGQHRDSVANAGR